MGVMAITVEELADRLNTEAARRGITTDQLLDELAARIPQPAVTGKRSRRCLAFAGIGASTGGRHARDADEMLAEGFGRS